MGSEAARPGLGGAGDPGPTVSSGCRGGCGDERRAAAAAQSPGRAHAGFLPGEGARRRGAEQRLEEPGPGTAASPAEPPAAGRATRRRPASSGAENGWPGTRTRRSRRGGDSPDGSAGRMTRVNPSGRPGGDGSQRPMTDPSGCGPSQGTKPDAPMPSSVLGPGRRPRRERKGPRGPALAGTIPRRRRG